LHADTHKRPASALVLKQTRRVPAKGLPDSTRKLPAAIRQRRHAPLPDVAVGFGNQVIDQADRISFHLKNASALGTTGAIR
jgi:hypothetical protein